MGKGRDGGKSRDNAIHPLSKTVWRKNKSKWGGKIYTFFLIKNKKCNQKTVYEHTNVSDWDLKPLAVSWESAHGGRVSLFPLQELSPGIFHLHYNLPERFWILKCNAKYEVKFLVRGKTATPAC